MVEMILLGAGASVEAGVPSAYTMTKDMSRRFRENWQLKKQSQLLSFVIGGLLFEQGQRGIDPLTSGVNIEDLFNAVQLLAERKTLEAAPFVGSWHTMVEEFDKIAPQRVDTTRLARAIYETVSKQIINALDQKPSSFEADRVDKALDETLKKALEASRKAQSGSSFSMPSGRGVGRGIAEYVDKAADTWAAKLKSASVSSSSDFERTVSQVIDAQQAKPGEGRIFYQTNEAMVRTLKDMVLIDNSTRIAYLVPILNKLQEQGKLVVATLNYDNAIELLASTHNVQCTTGITQWSSTGRFELGDDGLFLLKLHGSIDWVKQEGIVTPDRPLRHSVIQQAQAGTVKTDEFRPAVTFGQRNKLTADGPFLDLLRTFQQELAKADMLTVIGYSFRDPHINIYITQWLNQSRSRKLRVLDPNFSSSEEGYVIQLRQLQSQHPEQIIVVEKYAGTGLAEIYAAKTEAIVAGSGQ